VAKEKGFYARRGLDVEILRGGPGRDGVRALEEGAADFAILWLVSALSAVERGVPLVHVTQIYGSSSLSIVGWKDRGVTKIGDLDGRRVGVWSDPFRPAFTAFFRSQRVSPIVVPQYSTVSLFLLRAVDACSVTDYDEYHAIHLAGVDESELTRFALKDHGIDFPEDGLYCLRRTRDARPEVAKALAEGTLEGWRYAADHAEETLDLVMRQVRAANLSSSRAHMRWMLRTVLESVAPPSAPATATPKVRGREPGVLSRQAYDDTVRHLVESGVLRGAPPYDEFIR
jgi:NitT/TauT family transport system substrate-binding protein